MILFFRTFFFSSFLFLSLSPPPSSFFSFFFFFFFYCRSLVFFSHKLSIREYSPSSSAAMTLFSGTVFAFHSMNFKAPLRFYEFLIRVLMCNCKCWLGQQIRLIPETSTAADFHTLYRLKLPVFVSFIISSY